MNDNNKKITINLKLWFGLLFISLCSLGIWLHWYFNSDSYRHQKLIEASNKTKLYYDNLKPTNPNSTTQETKPFLPHSDDKNYHDSIDLLNSGNR